MADKLISKSVIIGILNRIKTMYEDEGNRAAEYAIENAINEVEQSPTVDAVEVVRCEKCKHWHHSGYCKKLGMEHDRLVSDFCSKGE